MIQTLVKKIVGTKNQRELKRMRPLVARINELEPEIQKLDDAALAAKTVAFRERLARMLADDWELQEALDELLPEAFAVVREAARRALGMRPYDVQLIGGIVLHQGKIAEMKTGEGKTLVATMPLYLNALAGRGAHLVTVNDYLARRDAEWMGKVYRFLGMSVGVVTHDATNAERKRAYAADITYGTNNEFGFDYLRDNMKYDLEEYVQRELFYAIVDEVDSILIDEARTPLIISGPTNEDPTLYYKIDKAVRQLIAAERKLGTDPTQDPKEGDNPGRYYHVDLEHKAVTLTEEGIALAEELTGVPNLYAPEAIEVLHHFQQSLRAHTLYHKDVDYVIKDGEIVIVDEFTGRLMPGRRWSDGLHQAVEAKHAADGVRVERENQTLATITFQNYFKMYDKLAGMTGTADTEAAEFHQIYNLDVVVIPTNKPVIRVDEPDIVFKREHVKFRAIAEKIKEIHEKGAPVLVGTTSIEKSERLYKALIRQGIPRNRINVLNAKQHAREAEIVAQAGKSGAITIATNMAGRGTDIVLGGNPEYLAWKLLEERGFTHDDILAEQYIKAIMLDQLDRARELAKENENLDDEELLAEIVRHRDECREDQKRVIAAGGLHIIGTERHESRRIDNQLRGRAGRQGDPGWSQFFLSLEDDLIKIFGGDRILNMMDRLGMEEEDAIQHPWLTKSIENAQKKVEARNFEIRKNLLEYDDVMNQQRTVVYKERRRILAGEELEELYEAIAEEVGWLLVDQFVPPKSHPEEWDWRGLEEAVAELGLDPATALPGGEEREALDDKELAERLTEAILAAYRGKVERYGAEQMQQILKFVMLQTLDQLWKDHLLAMDHLKEGVGLRGYGQKDPKREYAREGFELFQQMLDLFRSDVVRKTNLITLRTEEEAAQIAALEERLRARAERAPLHLQHTEQGGYGVTAALAGAAVAAAPVPSPPPGPAPPPAPHDPIAPGRSQAGGPTPAPMVAPRRPADVPKPPGRNDPCPCGSGRKYKKCCYPAFG